MRGFRPFVFRQALRVQSILSPFAPNQTLISTLKTDASIPKATPAIANAHDLHFSNFSLHFARTFGSSPGPSNILPIKSEEEFNKSLRKVQGESLPAIFYFTAVWCGPCRFISPVIGELSQKYPHVTTYKIDIDQEDLGSTLGKLNVTAVPTLLFFRNGKKEAEIIGADIDLMKDTMEKLYK